MSKEENKRKIQAAKTKSRIQASAIELFDQKGFENVSMEEIARAAGCSVGNLYHYFPNKDALTVLFTDQADQEYRLLEEQYQREPSMSAEDKLIDFSGKALEIDSKEELLFQSFVHCIRHPEQGYLRFNTDLAYFRILQNLILDYCRAESMEAPEYTEEMLHAFIIMNRGILLEWRIEEGQFDIVQEGRRMARRLLDGFRANGAIQRS